MIESSRCHAGAGDKCSSRSHPIRLGPTVPRTRTHWPNSAAALPRASTCMTVNEFGHAGALRGAGNDARRGVHAPTPVLSRATAE